MNCTKSPRYDFSTSCSCNSCEQTRADYIERIRARVRAQRRELAVARKDAPPDWVMVERILAQGPQSGARRKERGQAIEYLLRHGMSQRKTAERVGVTPKSVERYAARMRQRDGATK